MIIPNIWENTSHVPNPQPVNFHFLEIHPYFHAVPSHVIATVAAPAIPHRQDHATHLATPPSYGDNLGICGRPKILANQGAMSHGESDFEGNRKKT